MTSFSWGDLQQAADDAGFGVIPAGEYEVVVKTAEHKKTANGKDKITTRFSILSGPSEGKSVFNDFIISPDNGTALGFFFRHMKALGLGPDYFASNPKLDAIARDLVGKNCVVVVGIRQWNEEDRNEIKNIKPSGTATGAGLPPMTAPPAAQPQPMSQPQPSMTAMPHPQPQPTAMPHPQPTPTTQPQPAPAVSTKKAEPPKKAEQTEPVSETAPSSEPENTTVDDATPAKPELPF